MMKIFDFAAVLEMMKVYGSELNAFDLVILSCGAVLLVVQVGCCICWRSFSSTVLKKVQERSLYFCEFFPLAGLLGTMLALLTTLNSGTLGDDTSFTKFAPALTSTVIGLLMLIVNLVANFFLKD